MSFTPFAFNKSRLHLALYARGGAQTADREGYHWALIVGPKHEGEKSRGVRLHAKERVLPGGTKEWFFEERDISVTATHMLLIRITIAKVLRMERTLEILRAVPVKPEISGWTCKSWVQEAIALLDADGEALGKRVMDWNKVSEKAVSYCDEKKAASRFCGEGDFDPKYPPTFDLMEGDEGKEVVP
ncbi:hypothetical protein JVT61DRAFT_13638 [Boletus reticuloceps]|uniref:Uncharacterized protein n=1 Tax=Boletus reticuloceps TaxID=495285 RepID=A0A8I3A2M0_9AGAM|nr:hypothetical protein JVT61DRAFT_13638 [Boletus reticuloceps]